MVFEQTYETEPFETTVSLTVDWANYVQSHQTVRVARDTYRNLKSPRFAGARYETKRNAFSTVKAVSSGLSKVPIPRLPIKTNSRGHRSVSAVPFFYLDSFLDKIPTIPTPVRDGSPHFSSPNPIIRPVFCPFKTLLVSYMKTCRIPYLMER